MFIGTKSISLLFFNNGFSFGAQKSIKFHQKKKKKIVNDIITSKKWHNNWYFIEIKNIIRIYIYIYFEPISRLK